MSDPAPYLNTGRVPKPLRLCDRCHEKGERLGGTELRQGYWVCGNCQRARTVAALNKSRAKK